MSLSTNPIPRAQSTTGQFQEEEGEMSIGPDDKA
jgi:hypothetical protein